VDHGGRRSDRKLDQQAGQTVNKTVRIDTPGNPATIPSVSRGFRPVALRPTLSSGLPFSGSLQHLTKKRYLDSFCRKTFNFVQVQSGAKFQPQAYSSIQSDIGQKEAFSYGKDFEISSAEINTFTSILTQGENPAESYGSISLFSAYLFIGYGEVKLEEKFSKGECCAPLEMGTVRLFIRFGRENFPRIQVLRASRKVFLVENAAAIGGCVSTYTRR